MKRIISVMCLATLGATLSMTSSGWAQVAAVYGYYKASTLDGQPISGPLLVPIQAPPATAPLYEGRSVAATQAQMGIYCSTPVTTCALHRASYVGSGCSCRIPGGRTQGLVTP